MRPTRSQMLSLLNRPRLIGLIPCAPRLVPFHFANIVSEITRIK
jgi:hypothetical protein